MPEVVRIFTSPKCVYCNQAKDFLNRNSIDFEEISIATDAGRKELEDLGYDVIPIIITKGQVIKGFREDTLRKVFSIR